MVENIVSTIFKSSDEMIKQLVASVSFSEVAKAIADDSCVMKWAKHIRNGVVALMLNSQMSGNIHQELELIANDFGTAIYSKIFNHDIESTIDEHSEYTASQVSNIPDGALSSGSCSESSEDDDGVGDNFMTSTTSIHHKCEHC